MWELDYKESWALKNWCFWTVVLEKTLESSLDGKEIQPIHPKGDQFWVFIGRTDAEAETPILWPPDAKSWLTGKDLDAGERLKAGGEGDDREWDGWMASPTQWTWVWLNSGSWWWTGRPGVLQFIRLQRVGHDWATELNWSYVGVIPSFSSLSPARSTGPYRTVSTPFLPDSLWIFLYSFASRKVLSPASWSSSVRGAPHVVVFLTCSWWEMSSASAYLTISSSTT